VLEGPHGRGQEVKAQDIGTGAVGLPHAALRCGQFLRGARTGLTDPYAGTAQTLVQQAVPAVIAMQFEITDQAAIDFSNRFDAAIADSYPVEAATAEARKTVKNSPNQVEWATPVLYLRAPDGHLFHITMSSSQPSAEDAGNQSTTPSGEQGGTGERGTRRSSTPTPTCVHVPGILR
jgi:CHAT domain-containing protein